MSMSTPRRILFIGSKQLGFRVLKALHAHSPAAFVGVLTLDDRDDSRSVFSSIDDFCNAASLPLEVAKDRRQADEAIARFGPDLCIVVGWYWLLSKAILDSVPGGFIGIHNSLLPAYRGGSPLVWQMINGEARAGFSIFSFTPGMDDGPIWAQDSVPITGTDYVSDVLSKIEDRAVALFTEQLQKIILGSAAAKEQGVLGESYCAQRLPCDGKIDWTRPAAKIYDFIRAQSEPYPGAFTFLGEQKVTVWRAIPFEKPYYGTPGQIARITPQGLYVVCGGNSAITLLEVEVDSIRSAAFEVIKSVKTRFS